MLDLSAHCWQPFGLHPQTNNCFFPVFNGQPIIDGLPFQLTGRTRLYGRMDDGQRDVNSRDIVGLQVGRTFEELHLLHTTRWADLEGKTIAQVRLNYADGSRAELPIGYGVHVRDWQRLQTEETESLTDPNSKIIWRGEGVAHFKSSQRIFKSLLLNPHPEKSVATLDFLSAGQIASYQILAATLANHETNRPVTPAVPSDEPERHFDGVLAVRVEDPAGNPIPDVWVYPNIEVPETGWATITTPFYTTTNGAGAVRYPRGRSPSIYCSASKPGWQSAGQELRFNSGSTSEPRAVMVIRMKKSSEAVALVPPTTATATTTTNPATASSTTATATTTNAAPKSIAPPPNTGSGIMGATPSITLEKSCDHLVLIIDHTVGSNVRVDFTHELSPPNWQPLATITNLPFSPYPFDCGGVCPGEPQRFFRLVLLP